MSINDIERYEKIEEYIKNNHILFIRNLDDVLEFGKKHKYDTVREIFINDPSYIEWAVRENIIKLSKYLDIIFMRVSELPYGKREQDIMYGSKVLLEKDEEYRELLIRNTIKRQKMDEYFAELVKDCGWIEWLYERTISEEIIWEPVCIEIGKNGVINGKYEGYDIRVERIGVKTEYEYSYKAERRGLVIYINDIEQGYLDGYDWISTWNDILQELRKLYWIKEKEKKKTELEKLPNYGVLNIADIIVQSYDFYCEKNHLVEDVAVIIPVCDIDGTRYEITVPAGYCKECNHYFILSSVYYDLIDYGRPLCQVYENIHKRKEHMSSKMEGLALESPLHIYGYEVNKESNLSDCQRWAILEAVLDEKILTKENIISYLDWFCDTRKGNPTMLDALNKWQIDRRYILNYNTAEKRKVVAKSIVLNI